MTAPFARQSVADDACCDYCCATPVRIEFDGEKFCQACADKWVRGQAPDPDEIADLERELRHAGLYRGVEIEAQLEELYAAVRAA